MLRALGSASCDITHETRGTSFYGHWVLCLAISHTRQGVTMCYMPWVLRLVMSLTRQGVRFVTGICAKVPSLPCFATLQHDRALDDVGFRGFELRNSFV